MIAARRGTKRAVAAAALSALAVAALGALNTRLGPWYYNLSKPPWQPPDWLFGPAWTVIYALAALAAVIHWRQEPDRNRRLEVIAAFILNAFFNSLWTLLFFRLERPDFALYEVGFLWLSILLVMVLLGRTSMLTAWLLVPYLAWVTFASVLNWKIVMLNAPFPSHG